MSTFTLHNDADGVLVILFSDIAYRLLNVGYTLRREVFWRFFSIYIVIQRHRSTHIP